MATQSNNHDINGRAFALLEESFDMEDSDKVAYLRKACGEDQNLYSRCLSLIDFDLSDDDFQSLVYGNIEKPDENLHDLTGKDVGNYRVVKKIGSGGTAEVFLAFRNDEVHHEPLALKIIRGWGNTQELMDRMKQERKILSQFKHPNIANFLDGGNADDGRPYFVLEYVEGKPITDYCKEKQLGLRERLDLFVQVCSAVYTAHSKLTLHRDLKPSNIIVTESGVPKLLDFGIAKIIDENIEADTQLTQFYSPMTPQYASPEQVNQEPLSVASDQYSLGILLYELLTDQLPHDSAENKILHVSAEKLIALPSVKVTSNPGLNKLDAKRISKQLKGDLDAIVMKAISWEVDKRYSSVKEFAEDVRRYLKNKTILAQKSSCCYRTRLMLRRNKTTVALLATFAMLTGFLGVTLQMKIIAERDQAIVERQKFEQTQEFLVGLFKFSHPEVNREREVTVREVLDKGIVTIQNKFKQQPQVKIALLSTMAKAYQDLQLSDKALALYQESLSLQKKYNEEKDETLALTLSNLAELLIEKGANQQAQEYIDEALKIYRDLGIESSKNLAYAYSVSAVLSHRLGEFERGIEHVNSALQIRRSSHDGDNADIIRSYMLLGVIYTGKGDYKQAQFYNEKALALKLAQPENDQVTTSSILNTMAVVYHYQGQYEEALERYQQSIDIRVQLFGQNSTSLVLPYNNVGEVFTVMGEFDKAIAYHQQSLDILREHGDKDLFYVAVTHNRMADALSGKGDFESALVHIQTSIDIRKTIYGTGHHDLAKSYDSLAGIYARMGKSPEAVHFYQLALNIRAKVYGSRHVLTKQTKSDLSRVLASL
ncbi:Serine/threonine-protein kinase StkP [Thalassocella blandensis]|nr:Serine/threonine-protein kinase StkP [Thalassocella blandensis]